MTGQNNILIEKCLALIEEAKKVLENSYAPYSGIHVAAAVRSRDGSVFLGVNIENASYGLTICAERAAIASMVTAGKRSIDCLVVVSDTPKPLPPCGACRQVMAEFADDNAIIVSYSTISDEVRVWTLGELLPHAVKPTHILKETEKQKSTY
jgi:cytidine deaminase